MAEANLAITDVEMDPETNKEVVVENDRQQDALRSRRDKFVIAGTQHVCH